MAVFREIRKRNLELVGKSHRQMVELVRDCVDALVEDSFAVEVAADSDVALVLQ